MSRWSQVRRKSIDALTTIPLDAVRGKPLKMFTAHGRRDRLFLQSKDALFVVSLSDMDRTMGGGPVS
jgi:hypothetical protein